ncbi:hypothetical protein OG520_16905 [Streptomyces sp. NBC_00984]|uniref:hypothetical protein n=1 Tax=Streptomyces sp. NBC_00984 TaxID=2903700 RepID=UPI00386CE6FC|nr:hypothetical protein OG520_16905 [Streptomyces sp. NBC_00984]
MMRQHIKLSAVLVVVVLALTGFSTSRHGGRSGKSKSGGSSGSSGGGCSNSKKSNGSYHSSDYDDDDDSSSSSSGGTDYATETPSATASDEPQAYVFRCAQPRKGKRKAVTTSTVRLTANATGSHTYKVEVAFLNARGNAIDIGYATVDVVGGETETVSVRMDDPRKVSKVKKCRVEAELSY